MAARVCRTSTYAAAEPKIQISSRPAAATVGDHCPVSKPTKPCQSLLKVTFLRYCFVRKKKVVLPRQPTSQFRILHFPVLRSRGARWIVYAGAEAAQTWWGRTRRAARRLRGLRDVISRRRGPLDLRWAPGAVGRVRFGSEGGSARGARSDPGGGALCGCAALGVLLLRLCRTEWVRQAESDWASSPRWEAGAERALRVGLLCVRGAEVSGGGWPGEGCGQAAGGGTPGEMAGEEVAMGGGAVG